MLTDIETKQALREFAKYVIQQSRSNLTKKGKNVSKELYDSLSYNIIEDKNGYSLRIDMEDYGKFQDKGVRGADRIKKAPKSPYRFGSGTGKKGGLTRSIDKWVRKRNIKFRDKRGRFLTYKDTVFLISRSIYQTGIKPSMFFTKPFKKAFKRLPKGLVEAYAIGLEKDLIKITK
jgi:hypothetical protein